MTAIKSKHLKSSIAVTLGSLLVLFGLRATLARLDARIEAALAKVFETRFYDLPGD